VVADLRIGTAGWSIAEEVADLSPAISTV